MKTLSLIFALTVSLICLSQDESILIETSPSWKEAFDNYDIKIPDGKKFVRIDPKVLSLYNNLTYYTNDKEIVQDLIKSDSLDTLIKILNIDQKNISKFKKELLTTKVQIGHGLYVIYFDTKDLKKVESIMSSSRSLRESLNRMDEMGYDSGDGLDMYNKDFSNIYYTINGFYYSIRKLNSTESTLSIMVPVPKENNVVKSLTNSGLY